MKQLQLSVPTTKEDFRNIYTDVKLKIYGHRCKECNAKLKYSSQYHSGMLYEKRFMLHGHRLCDSCLRKRVINTLFTDTESCHWCDNPRRGTYKFKFKSGFTLGSSWWNGFHGCKLCILEGLKTTPLVSGITRYDKKTKKIKYK